MPPPGIGGILSTHYTLYTTPHLSWPLGARRSGLRRGRRGGVGDRDGATGRGGADLREGACEARHHSGGLEHSLPGGCDGGAGPPAWRRWLGVLAAVQGDGAGRGPGAVIGEAQRPHPGPGADRGAGGRRRAANGQVGQARSFSSLSSGPATVSSSPASSRS